MGAVIGTGASGNECVGGSEGKCQQTRADWAPESTPGTFTPFINRVSCS